MLPVCLLAKVENWVRLVSVVCMCQWWLKRCRTNLGKGHGVEDASGKGQENELQLEEAVVGNVLHEEIPPRQVWCAKSGYFFCFFFVFFFLLSFRLLVLGFAR